MKTVCRHRAFQTHPPEKTDRVGFAGCLTCTHQIEVEPALLEEARQHFLGAQDPEEQAAALLAFALTVTG